MNTYIVMWYDLESEKLREEVQAFSSEDAIAKATLLHDGNKPAPLVSAMKKDTL